MLTHIQLLLRMYTHKVMVTRIIHDWNNNDPQINKIIVEIMIHDN